MDRDKIDIEYKWDLGRIYKSETEFNDDIKFVYGKLDEFKKYENIDYTADSLNDLMDLMVMVNRVIDKLEAYVSLLSDEDTRINKNQELKEKVNNLYSDYIKVTYFVRNSILKLDYEEIKKFYKDKGKLLEYERYFLEMFRYKEHILSQSEEKLLANMARAMGNNYDTYELLKDADLTFPSFKIGKREYPLDSSRYSLYIEDDDRTIRKKAFMNVYQVYKQFKDVFANLISANIKEEVCLAKIHNYKSALEESLYHDELDTKIYGNLINTVNERMDTIYKYYQIKKKILGVKELHLYDVYANLITDNNFKYPFDQAKETVISALSILGDEYVSILKKGIDNKWIDVYPNKGKRSGGYSGGSYDTEPYILLNYQDKYDDMSTLAHELGHSMHSYYARHNNPYQYGYYSIFVAEVASTVNELLLAKYVIKNSSDKFEKLFILNRMMELYRATIYRQTMFAEFEKKIYDKIENDEPITADILCDTYYDINKKYFGRNVCVDDEIRYEWERIPHFYYNFYVYKYATGLSAASMIVDGLLNGKIKQEDYLNFLKCGKSKSPIESLKLAGVNLEDKEVINKAIDMFDDIINEFSQLYFG